MISRATIQAILSQRQPEQIEALAQQARAVRDQQFGRAIGLYAPLYLSNFCSSHCTYCGFHSHNRIDRFKLSPEQMDQEMRHLAGQGIETILLLTGESYKVTPVSYLLTAVEIAKQHFSSIQLEVHPMAEADYRQLFEQGVDGVTVYQETYDRKRYAEVHLAGIKADFEFRYAAPARAAAAGMRHLSLGILLGLSDDVLEDLWQLYQHLHDLETRFPGVEYSLSFPRFQPIKGEDFAQRYIDDITFVQVIAMTRIHFPRVGINLSTREKPNLRDNLFEIGITRLSAGSNTAVGGYTLRATAEQDPQFDIEDQRSVAQVVQSLKDHNFDPVFTEWRRIKNAELEFNNT